MLKRIGLVMLAALALLIAVLAINTLRLRPEKLGRPLPPPPVDGAAVQHLAQAIRIPTISTEAGPAPDAVLDAFAAHLAASYPRVHATLAKEVVAGHSLLFTWPGTDPGAPALLLAAHQDVVPIEGSSGAKWTHPRFDGTVADGFIWGRGTIDDKMSLIAILEAAERLLARGYRPRQTIYLAFGHDEERGGSGARTMAALLKARGARIGLALDEGYAVLDGVLAGVSRPVAVVGMAEKGYVSVELTASGAGGHSSMPTPDNAAVHIARAVERLADDPFPARVQGLTGDMLTALAPYMDQPLKTVIANRWLTEPLIRRQLVANPRTAAALRTTTAPTIVQAGTKDNVLPQSARAVVNHRILPGDTIDSVVARDREVVDDPKVTVRAIAGGHNPSHPASTRSAGFRELAAAIRATYPSVPIAPGLVLGATDGRYYEPVAAASLRFTPMTMRPADLARFHGNDERIAIEDFVRAIGFYERLISGGVR
ncbi:M20/M25/M40 family metallo-hydrolase [Sphingomonas sp. MAH-20]|uniref:M20/M25/M40 family metallo-hydrolase n=1 Tax=Sphingomonas horti TaxID=2682842 RepID=A0A6I4J2Z6_9SPHN|nr:MULTISPECIES: M20 family peptidase [Sphingomonas]MBA2918593.1 M20/M25/M40 family metallo-hydrolase [Sphingomonas sp. CGMCC 1.13658]MVO78624.1 M20/M25/M40 family metallo-hydrolase [Sphingomonas horti]